MNEKRWSDIERLLHEARQLPQNQLHAFLAAIGDADMRAEVSSLLATESEASGVAAVIRDAAGAVLGEASADPIIAHFHVLRELGRGGMGEVYLATDINLARRVALKLLPSIFQGDSERVSRFEREARAAAALNHPNIVTVYEVGQWQGQPYIAMELIEGETLDQRLRHGRLRTAEAARIGAQIADALTAAHEAGIVHRDLKPGNIMLRPDGTVKVLDFGLARLSPSAVPSCPPDDEATKTQTATLPGVIMGTLSYMSPEQARGEVADARSDLWSLGVVLYQSLGGKRPFEGRSQSEIIASILAREPIPLNSLNPDVPSSLAGIVTGLLIKDRDQRRSPASRIAQDLKQFVSHSAIARPTRKWVAAFALLLMALTGGSAWLLYGWSKRQWARHEAIPLARTLTDKGDFVGAYRVALDAARYISDEPALQHLWPDVSQLLSVRSEPPGAVVLWKEYGQQKAPWQKLGLTPLAKIRVPAGPLRIQVSLPGYEPIEAAVDRFTTLGEIPLSDYLFKLHPVGSPASRMIRVPGLAARSTLFTSRRTMADFEMDRYEVTNREFQEFVNSGGYANRKYWEAPFVRDGREISWEQAMARFVDPTSRPGPATWEAGAHAPGHGDEPVSGVSWYEAAAYAAFAGKSLPSIAHWQRAASLNVVATDYRFVLPLSNLAGGRAWPVGSSGAVNSFGLYDVAGNVREWCWNQSGARRSILGGSWADGVHDARADDNADPFDRSAINGFRCVRYQNPGQVLAEYGDPVVPAHRPDYTKVRPASDETFEVYRGLYAYEKKPLNASVESIDGSSELWRREKIRFSAPYGNEQMIAYLFLPKQGKPPFQCVSYMGDGGTLRPGSGETIQPEHFILRSGRAMIYPIYKGTLDRYVQTRADPVARRDQAIMWYRDLASSIDYLETRSDIDRAKLAYMGHSMGTRFSPTILAMENRVKVAVLLAGGLEAPGALPEADPVTFLPRVKTPVLLVAGLYDPGYPVETAQNPMIELLGTSPKDKRHVILPVGHATLVPDVRTVVVREALDWLDRYLGRP